MPKLLERRARFLAIEQVGRSLLDLRLDLKGFSLKTVLMIAIKTLTALEDLHSCGYVHHDIKPDNLAIAMQAANPRVYLIDLGLSMPFCSEHLHCAYSEGNEFQGTPFFCSLNTLNGIRASRRDDAEALGYVLVYLLTGKLPWVSGPRRSMRDIRQVRSRIGLQEVCAGVDLEFQTYLEACQSLRFDEKPNYSLFRQLFSSLAKRKNIIIDWKYDWSPAFPAKIESSCKLSSSEHTTKRSAHKHLSANMKELDLETLIPHPGTATLTHSFAPEEDSLTPLLDPSRFPCFRRKFGCCPGTQVEKLGI